MPLTCPQFALKMSHFVIESCDVAEKFKNARSLRVALSLRGSRKCAKNTKKIRNSSGFFVYRRGRFALSCGSKIVMGKSRVANRRLHLPPLLPPMPHAKNRPLQHRSIAGRVPVAAGDLCAVLSRGVAVCHVAQYSH